MVGAVVDCMSNAFLSRSLPLHVASVQFWWISLCNRGRVKKQTWLDLWNNVLLLQKLVALTFQCIRILPASVRLSLYLVCCAMSCLFQQTNSRTISSCLSFIVHCMLQVWSCCSSIHTIQEGVIKRKQSKQSTRYHCPLFLLDCFPVRDLQK